MSALPEPWCEPFDSDSVLFERELAVEVGAGHPLHGLSARLIARRLDRDDALFSLADGRLAEVHLTWRKSVEPDCRWPSVSLFSGLDEWRMSCRP